MSKQNPIKCSGIDHVVLYVRDPKIARTFYVDILGMTVKRESTGYIFLHCGDQLIGLFVADEQDETGQGLEISHLAFTVMDQTRDQVAANLETNGVAVHGRSGDPECIYFNDPDGHCLQIMARG
ncbi:MAG: VOC family protein [Alphaproteobacteria bacterium]|jgi:catechol 2,3-dioxygenase-like lactoylglutathione lyase family enzyme